MQGVAGLEEALLGSAQQGSLKSRLDVIDEQLGFNTQRGGEGGKLRKSLDLSARSKRADVMVFGEEKNLELTEGVAGLEEALLGSAQQGSLNTRLDTIDEQLGFGPK
eukprot:2662172-Rhodomonas_salina.1